MRPMEILDAQLEISYLINEWVEMEIVEMKTSFDSEKPNC
jgi:hypothetical protein